MTTTTTDEATLLQIERILQSEALRSADALRQLLRYLAAKTLAGDADGLKEYIVGVEALGKPTSYDPREESTVRIQIGRLRQKLVEYYHAEGKNDPIVVDLPKGRFKLTFEARELAAPAIPSRPGSTEPKPVVPSRYMYGVLAAMFLLASCVWAIYSTLELRNERRQTALFRDSWNPEIQAFWGPFISPNHPLLIVVGTPQFADVPGFGTYGDRSTGNWEDLMKSPASTMFRKLYKDIPIQPYSFLTGMAEAGATFQLGKLLGLRTPSISIARSSEVSWEQFADNNVICVGAWRIFQQRLQTMPIELQFLQSEGGIRALHPTPGEPEIPDLGYGTVRGTGEQYALVSTTPGPAGKGIVRMFTSTGTSARLAALQAFTDPVAARSLFGSIAGQSGTIPKYFQVVLKIKYVDGVATETQYVTHRELLPRAVR